jgi:hypothetical protein
VAARLEDGDVDLTVLAEHLELEIGLDVFGGDAVFVDESAGDALANLLLVGVFHRLAGDVVEELALFERAFGAWVS